MSIIPFLLFLLPVASALSNFPIVQTSYGSVRGYEVRAANGFVGEIYKKIPFAAPPVGNRRWRKPQPPEAWNYTLDGTFFGPACAQVPSMWTGYVTGMSEDCLAVNIYTSRKCRESNASCPVVHYVHGGSALFSGPHQFPDELLMRNYAAQEVILVTCTYRVGVFGVMALGDEAVLPANLAMHDVLESLRFVRREIHNFGGDKDQITLWGSSAGSTIVLAHVFSPSFNKPGEPPLFARAMTTSPSAIYEDEQKQVSRSQAVAAKLGCIGTAREIIDCMRLFGTDEILQAATDVGGPDMMSLTHISGIVLAGELMPYHNMKDLREQQRAHMAALSKPTKYLLGSTFNEFRQPTNAGQNIDGLPYQVTEVLGVKHEKECAERYFSDFEAGRIDTTYDTLSQALYETVSLFGAAQADAGGEVYIYQLDYPQHSSHSDDLFYLLGNTKREMDDNEAWLSHVYPTYFTNFIKGLPLAPGWKPLDTSLMNYYSINKSLADGTEPMMKYGYHQDLADYYKGLMEFDEKLSIAEKLVLNAPVQYRNFNNSIVSSSEPFNLRDLLFYSAVIGVLLYIVFKSYRCLCTPQGNVAESTPLTV